MPEGVLDAGRGMNENHVDDGIDQLDGAFHVVGLEPVEHAGIAGRKQRQVGHLLVLHHRLLEPAGARQHLLGRFHDAVLETQQQIKVAQSEVCLLYPSDPPDEKKGVDDRGCCAPNKTQHNKKHM